MNKKMNKKFAIVTGANGGIGTALVEKMHGEYNLLLIIENTDKIINKYKNDDSVMTIKADVSNKNEFADAINLGIKKFGEVDTIINNAGIMNLSQLDVQDDEKIERMANSNFKGVIYGTKLVIESMLKNKKGTILNVASTAGLYPYPEHAVYCGTKYGVRGFSQTMRIELASKNIRVMILSPGAVLTNLLQNGTTDKEIIKNYLEWRDSNNSALEAKDVANAIYFAITQPQSVNIREIEMTSINQTA